MTGAQGTELCNWLEGRTCRSAHEIRAHIRAKSGICHSHSGCLKLLARLGFEYRKPKAADAGKQAGFIAFYENLFNSLGADEAVYFADAVHPEYHLSPAPQPDRAALGRHAPIRHAEPILPNPKAMRGGHLDVLSRNNPRREGQIPRSGHRQLPCHLIPKSSALAVIGV